ncbi:LEF-9-like protein [Glossina pallidipes salivary gland hypertrophy virus]|uniref:LEF-9-like protein n=1 Tax=Glossina hytrovirus (isolate Glossina pallidipes/Ethiopia/Seibersdorf/-) TaxID=379529 RepID=A0A0Y0K797_GHVS|nr:LEF-9-like protein [Glossina pallidipes salivary gland hypertrophy virus]
MYKRKLNTVKVPFAHLYLYIRERETYKWLSNQQNVLAITQIMEKASSSCNGITLKYLFESAEPTATILNKMLVILATIYSSSDAVDFYNFILKNVISLANGEKETNPLYDENLPSDYTMTNDLLNKNLIAVCMSESKGTIESYNMILDKYYKNEQSTMIQQEKKENENKEINIQIDSTIENILSNVTETWQSMAKKSREVRTNGHNFFKSSIGYETLSFDNNHLMYNSQIIYENIDELFPLVFSLSPDVAVLLTFFDYY